MKRLSDVKRMGYGAMQLAGPGIFGPPNDPDEGRRRPPRGRRAGCRPHRHQRLLRPARANQIIREALHPYPDELVIVTKLGARRGEDGSWQPAASPEELIAGGPRQPRPPRPRRARRRQPARSAGLGRRGGPSRSRSRCWPTCSEQGLIRHIGPEQRHAGAVRRGAGDHRVVCVQNHYNLAHRDDDAFIDDLRRAGHPLRAVLPARRVHAAAVDAAGRRRRHLHGATPMQVALAWLLQRSPNILLIPGTVVGGPPPREPRRRPARAGRRGPRGARPPDLSRRLSARRCRPAGRARRQRTRSRGVPARGTPRPRARSGTAGRRR